MSCTIAILVAALYGNPVATAATAATATNAAIATAAATLFACNETDLLLRWDWH
jgi:hypothetical protein